MLHNLVRFAAALAVICAVTGGFPTVPFVAAQDDGSTADEPVVDKPAAREFKQTFERWKDVLKELRDIKFKFAQVAEDTELDALRTQFDAALLRAKQLIPELRTKGVAAYAESPNEDRQLTRFLVKLAADDLTHDLYDEAAGITTALLENECEDKKVYDLAGIAAFATHEFDKADEYLTEAQALGVLSDRGRGMLAGVDDYKKFWKDEQEIREKEAAGDKLPRVKLQTTKGTIVVELFEHEAPGAVGNFVSLVESGFYDDITFHRVLANYMAQGGCPQGDGFGGPGYKIYCETDRPDYRRHFRGSLSMAKSPEKDTGGSQFFLTFLPTPQLNGKHTVFGRVVEGLDVLANIQRRDPDSDTALPDPDRIIKATVEFKRNHEYVPNKVQ